MEPPAEEASADDLIESLTRFADTAVFARCLLRDAHGTLSASDGTRGGRPGVFVQTVIAPRGVNQVSG